jgi:predicted dehydrogenase
VQPYNWHWFRVWGTGEALNNGTHEVDVARWALGVDYPQRVSAQGGRYAYQDDWQFYDTLVTNWEYPDAMITWESRSCNGDRMNNRDRGATILGTNGSVLVDRDGYEVYDLGGKKTDEFRVKEQKTSSADLIGADSMTDRHFANFIGGITKGEKLHSPVEVGNVAVTMLQLTNIAWEVQRPLKLNPAAGGKIVDDAEAMKGWGREYQPGWEPKV